MARLIKKISLWIVISMSVYSQSVYDNVILKQGKINKNETWSGKIILTGDIIIPTDITVTIKPNTWLIFQTQDHHHLGNDPNKIEIIVEGNLIAEEQSSIQLINTQNPKFKEFLNQFSSTIYTYNAKPVSTKKIESQWRSYKHQYAIMWALMYSLAVIL